MTGCIQQIVSIMDVSYTYKNITSVECKNSQIIQNTVSECGGKIKWKIKVNPCQSQTGQEVQFLSQ